MRKIFSQLLLLVGLSLIFNACGETDTQSEFSTNISGGGNTPSQDNSKSPAETKPADNGDRVTKSATKVLFVDTICSNLPTTILNVNNEVIGTGKTGEDGSFDIPSDSDAEYVQFSLGGITLGKVKISEVIAISELFKNSNLNDRRVLFTARLLLSLDADSNSLNGIQLSDVSERMKDFEGIEGHNINNLNVDEETATKLLIALLDFLGMGSTKVVTETEAKSHLEGSMNDLEDDVSIVILENGDENCPNGGIKKIHKVDFDKTDSNTEKTTYTNYICDAPLDDSNKDEVTNFILTAGNEKCPDGGIRTHHKLYNSTQNLLSEYDEYRCKGAEAYKTNTFIFYSATKEGKNSECQNSITKKTQITKENSISVTSKDDEFICVDSDLSFVEISTIVKDEICKIGGMRVKNFTDNSKTELVSTSYFCNQETKNGNIQGEHLIIVTDADSDTCPNGGTFLNHYVDYDNNGESETEYREVKCNYSQEEIKNLDGEVTIITTKILLNAENRDEHCPNGGYRLERKMMQNNNIIAEYNDFNCSDFSESLFDDRITMEILRSSDYGTSVNSWCPNGGLKSNHEVYFYDVLNHSYYDIECSPASEKDNITETILPFEDKNCPNGGKSFHHSVVFNGDAGHKSNYEYDTVVCSDFDYENDSYELNDEKTLLIGDDNCPFGGKAITHKRYMKDETNQHLAYLDFTSIECNEINYDNTEEDVTVVQRFILGDGNTVCPDGGEIRNHRRFVLENGEKKYLSYWDYNTTHCSGLNYDDTIDVEKVTDENPEVCPYGGKVVLHQRFLLDKEGRVTTTHIAKWDYSTTTCNTVDYANTLEKKDIETLDLGSEICPDGGEIISHSRYVDENENGEIDSEDRHIADWDFSETICNGLNYDDTVADEVVTVLDFGNEICPDGGKVIEYIRYIDADKDGKFTKDVDVERVQKWDYTSTQCSGLNYDETEDRITLVYLDFGNEICPDGGEIAQHKFYANLDANPDFETHIAKWDYETTTCKGLNYSDTLKLELAFDAPESICPDGGSIVQTIRYIDNNDNGEFDESDTHVYKWDFNSTYCIGLEYEQTLEHRVTLTAPESICPDGGEIISIIRYIDINHNGVYDTKENANKSKIIDAQFTTGGGSETRDVGVISIINEDSTPADISYIQFDTEKALSLDLAIERLEENGQIKFTGALTLDEWDKFFREIKLLSPRGEDSKQFTVDFTVKNSNSANSEGFVLGNPKLTEETTESLTASLDKWKLEGVDVKGFKGEEPADLSVVTTKDVLQDYQGTKGLPFHKSTGLGVSKGQILFKDGIAEKIVIAFDEPVTNIEVGFTGLGGRFIDSAKAVYEFYYLGKLVKTRGTLDRSFDFDNDGYLATNITEANILIDKMVFTIELEGENRNPANYSVRYIKGNRITDKTVFTQSYSVATGLTDLNIDKHITRWDRNETHCIGLDYSETIKQEFNTTLEIGSSECPDGGTLVNTVVFVDLNNNGTYEENEDNHIEHWDLNSTYCNGLEYDETLKQEFNTTLAIGDKDCPDGGTLVNTVVFVDLNNNGTYEENEDTHIEHWDFNSTYCNGEVADDDGSSIDTGLTSGFTVVGSIKDINGSVIEGAKVTLYISKRAFTVETGSNGAYKFYNANLGFYIVVEADGYEKSGYVKITSHNIDITLIPERLSYVKDMKLIFFNIDREMGGDKALEYAKTKGFRLLTFEELSVLYNSDRKSEFKNVEYFSSTHKVDKEDGYTLKSINFANGEVLDFWFDWRKHIVFTNIANDNGIESKLYFAQRDSWAQWDSANAICSSLALRLPSVEEIKGIYFNSRHPIGVTEEYLVTGEYWTLDSNEVEQTAKFFRMVGADEDYYIDHKADKLTTKRVLCVQPDESETSELYGKVTDSDNKGMKDIKISLISMDSDGKSSNVVSTAQTDANGNYFIDAILSNRYLVLFDPVLFDAELKSETATIDLQKNSTLNMQFTGLTDEDDDSQDKGVCDNSSDCASSNVFDIRSVFDKDTNRWTYTVTQGAEGNIKAKNFTLKLSELCLAEITELSGGSAVSLNGKGYIDSIKSDENTKISFLVSSTAGYDLDVEAPLVILTENNTKLGVNIAVPVCFPLMVENSRDEITSEIEIQDISISGNVKTSKGKTISGANITIKGENGATLKTLVTDEYGSYSYSTKTGTKVSIEVSSEKYKTTFLSLTKISNTINQFNFELEAKTISYIINLDVLDSQDGQAITNAIYIVRNSNNEAIATDSINSEGKTKITLTQTTEKDLEVSLEVSAQGFESHTEIINISKGQNSHQTTLTKTPATESAEDLIFGDSSEEMEKAFKS